MEKKGGGARTKKASKKCESVVKDTSLDRDNVRGHGGDAPEGAHEFSNGS